ncbi:hypothetical protein C7830_24970 [Pandoraea apista]|nr:hypothetical protein C7830_24970 [Pandoraea apista]
MKLLGQLIESLLAQRQRGLLSLDDVCKQLIPRTLTSREGFKSRAGLCKKREGAIYCFGCNRSHLERLRNREYQTSFPREHHTLGDWK